MWCWWGIMIYIYTLTHTDETYINTLFLTLYICSHTDATQTQTLSLSHYIYTHWWNTNINTLSHSLHTRSHTLMEQIQTLSLSHTKHSLVCSPSRSCPERRPIHLGTVGAGMGRPRTAARRVCVLWRRRWHRHRGSKPETRPPVWGSGVVGREAVVLLTPPYCWWSPECGHVVSVCVYHNFLYFNMFFVFYILLLFMFLNSSLPLRNGVLRIMITKTKKVRRKRVRETLLL